MKKFSFSVSNLISYVLPLAKKLSMVRHATDVILLNYHKHELTDRYTFGWKKMNTPSTDSSAEYNQTF